jgi:hypothetical protein
MTKVLVKFSGNYGDEFDCEEFNVFESQAAADAWIDIFENYIDQNGSAKVYFGTNEFLEFNHVDDLLNDLEIFDISGKSIFNKKYTNVSVINEEVNLSTGVYFVKLKNEDNSKATLKLVKE